jgi:hypothetical protein
MIRKITQFYKQVAKTVVKPKNAKISTSKLNLKVCNNYIKPLLKPKLSTTYRVLKLLI